jgi:hypothetical protein
MNIQIIRNTLSDGSHTWDVALRDEEGTAIHFAAIDRNAAVRLADKILGAIAREALDGVTETDYDGSVIGGTEGFRSIV